MWYHWVMLLHDWSAISRCHLWSGFAASDALLLAKESIEKDIKDTEDKIVSSDPLRCLFDSSFFCFWRGAFQNRIIDSFVSCDTGDINMSGPRFSQDRFR